MRPTRPRPWLEEAGLGLLRRRAARQEAVVPDDAIHFLNERERQDLRRIQAWAVLRAGVAGVLSAGAVAAAEVVALPALGLEEGPDLASSLPFYAALLAVAGGAAILEIGYLYLDALRAVHDLARAAGLDLGEEDTDDQVAAALARAALELPDPREPVLGVDPNREISGWRLVAVSGLYKLKIALSSFLAKAVLRRALGRAVVRSWLPFVGVPITALWNAAVAFKVLREARLRVMGPSAVEAALDIALAQPLSPAARDAAARAVATTIVKKHRMHPNHRTLLERVQARIGTSDDADLDDPAVFLRALQALPRAEAQPVLQILATALVLDGRFSRRDRALMQAAEALAPEPDLSDAVGHLRREFVRGHGIEGVLMGRFTHQAREPAGRS